MRVTLNNIAKAIFDKHGHKVELVRGNGYYYFTAAEDDYRLAPITYAHGSSVYTNVLAGWSVDRWVSEYETLIEDAIIPENATEERTGPKTIVMLGTKF